MSLARSKAGGVGEAGVAREAPTRIGHQPALLGPVQPAPPSQPGSGAGFRRSYAMHGAIAAGGMATVHVGRLLGPSGFSRRVAIKRLHPQLAANEDIASMFAAEARLSARIVHANVVPVLDVVSADGELLLVMEYVHGESLSRLLSQARKTKVPVPIPVVVTVLADVLHGLHAAHEATGEDGAPMRLVHRDVSPQNVLVGSDGVARVVDFGIAKAIGQATVTRDGTLRGKVPYMAPEQIQRLSLDRRVDVYAAGVVLWEALAGRRLFEGEDEPALFDRILGEVVPPPSRFDARVSPQLDAIAARAMQRDPDRRFPDAQAMAVALEGAIAHAPSSAVAEWVKTTAAAALAEREAKLSAMERDARGDTSEPGLPAIRAPFASVFLQDVAGTSATDDGAAPRSAGSVPARSGTAGSVPESRGPGKRPLVLGGLAVLFFVAVVVAIVLLLRPSPDATAASIPSASAAVPSSAPEPAASPSPELLVVPPPATSSPPASTPGTRLGAPGAKGGNLRLCKVFDPDKQIFVMRSMRVSRCP